MNFALAWGNRPDRPGWKQDAERIQLCCVSVTPRASTNAPMGQREMELNDGSHEFPLVSVRGDQSTVHVVCGHRKGAVSVAHICKCLTSGSMHRRPTANRENLG